MPNIYKCTCRKATAFSFQVPSGLHSALPNHSLLTVRAAFALSQQKLPETLKLLNVMEEAAGKIV